jgi:hypothetical protein
LFDAVGLPFLAALGIGAAENPSVQQDVEDLMEGPAAESTTTSTFWTGWGSQSTAETWAANNTGQTLSMSPFAVAQEATPEAIQAASTSFAQAASGPVQVFQPAAGIPVNSVWSQFEYPALMQNPNVPSITYQIIDGSRNIISTIRVPK